MSIAQQLSDKLSLSPLRIESLKEIEAISLLVKFGILCYPPGSLKGLFRPIAKAFCERFMDTTYLGLAFYKDKWKYFDKYKPVKRGKYKGHYRIAFVNESIPRLIHPDHVKRMPTKPGQLRLF